MRVGVVGSRDFNDYSLLSKELDKLNITSIVSGGARGADSLSEKYARDNNIETIIFKAEWDKYGKRAGYIRNKEIWNNSDVIVAFWDGVSKGTRHTIDEFDGELIVIKYKETKMAVKDILAEVEVNEELASSELESGSTGGGYVKKCGVYPMTIEKAFFTETKKGGLCLDLHFGGENIFTAKLYPVSVRDGKKVTSYEYKGKAVSLGDYKLLKQLLFVTNGKPMELKDLTTTEETVTYKSFGKDVTVEAETCEDLVGKNVMVGVRLAEKYAYDSEEGEVDKTQLATNSDGDIVYDMFIYTVYSQSGKTPTEIIKKEDAKQIDKDREFLESDKGIKRVKLEAASFEEEELDLGDGGDELDF